jgi:DNA polymerase-3 subunit beta
VFRSGAVDRSCPLVVSGRGIRSTLSTHRPEDYPVRQEPPSVGCHALERRHLARLIRTTAFAVDPACTRYQLGGCFFNLAEDSIDVVATDGCRLAHAWKRGVRVVGTPAPASTRDHGGTRRSLAPVVGARALRLLLRSLDELKAPLEPAELDWTPDGYLRVRSGDLSCSSRQLEGRFPDWRGAFPPPSPHRGHFTRSDRLLAILKRAAAVAGRERPRVRVGLEPGKVTLVTAAPAPVERFETYCDYRSEPFGAVFNPEQLIDVLGVLDGETVDLELNGPGIPGAIHAAGLRYCVMPLDPAEPQPAQAGGPDGGAVP